MVGLSKIATGNGQGENSPYFKGLKAYESDPYHPTKNPDGVIQMDLAENQLCFDLVKEWVMSHPEAFITTAEGLSKSREIAMFDNYHGIPAFRRAVAKFMEKVRGNRVTFDPNRIVITSGGETGAHETVAFCLADPGEAFLVPAPYDPGFDFDLRWRTGVQLVPVLCESSINGFKVTRAAFEAAYEKAIEGNIRVKGVLISNPSNPIGTFLDRETLRSLVSFINEKNIHLVCDEIYAATVFVGQPNFISISEVIKENNKWNRDLIHIVCSTSRDMGFPGFRVGIIYSYNDAVVDRTRKMSSFGLVSSQTQHLFASILSDDEFVEKFLAESAKRLAARYTAFTQGLAQIGIGCLKSNAGLSLWMDLHHLLKEETYEAEMELWQLIINEDKLNVSPGSRFHFMNPGWFRVCFANMDDQTMEIALSRIRTFMLKNKPGCDAREHLSQIIG